MNSREIAISSLFGTIIFVQKAALPAPYDKLIITTGSTAIVPDLPGIELDGITTLQGMEGDHKILAKGVFHIASRSSPGASPALM